MRFIKLELKLRFRAIEGLLDEADELWRKREFLAYIRIMLVAIITTVLGILLFPITVVISAIKWHSDLDEFEEAIEEVLGNHNDSEN